MDPGSRPPEAESAAAPVIQPLLWTVGRRLLWAWIILRHRTRVEGAESLPPGAFVAAAKHSSWMDIPILGGLIRDIDGRRPFFEMGSFVGYRVLGLLKPCLRRVGGFPVMRPKEILRLRRKTGMDREAVVAVMEASNRAARAVRRAIFRAGGVLAYFPEGTRAPGRVLPLRSTVEIEDAIEAARETPVRLVPVRIVYRGRPPGMSPFRRRIVDVALGPPMDLAGRTLEEAVAAVSGFFRDADFAPPATSESPAEK